MKPQRPIQPTARFSSEMGIRQPKQAMAPGLDWPELLTVKEFLWRFSISRTQFYREVQAGRLRLVKLGAATRVTKADALAWLRELQRDDQS